MEAAQTKELNAPQTTNGQLSLKERLLEAIFVRQLSNLQSGCIQFTGPSGRHQLLGDQQFDAVKLQVWDADFYAAVFAGGSVAFGEAYQAGQWSTNDLPALLTLIARNQQALGRIRKGFSWLQQRINRLYHQARKNTLQKSRENIQAHYDLSNDFYQCFLDASMTYSSALFTDKAQSLEAAQMAKIDRMLDLAEIPAGGSILEIGTGWGALALRAAERGYRVKTITLSQEQYTYARQSFINAGRMDVIDLQLQDYRTLDGQYDAVVSCEMIEAVGKEYLDSYFEVIAACLKPTAKAVIQAITIPDERYEAYCRQCDWIQKHIFPGGHLPSPGALQGSVTRTARLKWLSAAGFGQDYARTLQLWFERFNAASKQIHKMGFDAAFCRKWNYYLAYCEAGFMTNLIDVKHLVVQRIASPTGQSV